MKKIINGKKYNTETAKEIGIATNGNYGSFSYWCEILYQKKTGKFFLYGKGGASSRYAKSVSDNCWGSGEEIIPMSVESAKRWAEKNLDVDAYEEVFGEVEE